MTSFNVMKLFRKNSLGLSLFLHLLFLWGFLHLFVKSPVPEVKPDLYVSSYLYQDVPSPSLAVTKTAPVRSTVLPVTTSPQGTKPPTPLEAPLPQSPPQPEKKIAIQKPADDLEAIHLIGNKKALPAPLIKLLAKALTASLAYPKMAADFRLKGTAYVRFLVYPDGHITNVQLVKSSSADVLDQAALNAVLAISPLNQVGPYLSQPKYIVFGFIFG